MCQRGTPSKAPPHFSAALTRKMNRRFLFAHDYGSGAVFAFASLLGTQLLTGNCA
jgi:hypothetical protein